MTFDHKQLELLAQFARGLDAIAPPGESYDELQQAHAGQKVLDRESLRRRIAALEVEAQEAWEAATQEVRDYRTTLQRERMEILQDPSIPERYRNARLREHEQAFISPVDLFDLNLGAYHAIMRRRRRLQRELDRKENES